MDKIYTKETNEQFQYFYMNYLLSILEGLRQRNDITEEIFINARNNAYKKYGNNDKNND